MAAAVGVPRRGPGRAPWPWPPAPPGGGYHRAAGLLAIGRRAGTRRKTQHGVGTQVGRSQAVRALSCASGAVRRASCTGESGRRDARAVLGHPRLAGDAGADGPALRRQHPLRRGPRRPTGRCSSWTAARGPTAWGRRWWAPAARRPGATCCSPTPTGTTSRASPSSPRSACRGASGTSTPPAAPGSACGASWAGRWSYEYFPVDLGQLAAAVRFHDLGEGGFDAGGVRVTACYLNHPALTLGYRLEAGGAVLVYATDHEPHGPLARPGAPPSRRGRAGEAPLHHEDRRHVAFLAGADLVVHDAQYALEEYPAKAGWGHSAAEHAVDLALAAGARRLALFHHDPLRDDAALDRLVEACRRRAGEGLEVFAAAEGPALELPERPGAAARGGAPAERLPGRRRAGGGADGAGRHRRAGPGPPPGRVPAAGGPGAADGAGPGRPGRPGAGPRPRPRGAARPVPGGRARRRGRGPSTSAAPCGPRGTRASAARPWWCSWRSRSPSTRPPRCSPPGPRTSSPSRSRRRWYAPWCAAGSCALRVAPARLSPRQPAARPATVGWACALRDLEADRVRRAAAKGEDAAGVRGARPPPPGAPDCAGAPGGAAGRGQHGWVLAAHARALARPSARPDRGPRGAALARAPRPSARYVELGAARRDCGARRAPPPRPARAVCGCGDLPCHTN